MKLAITLKVESSKRKVIRPHKAQVPKPNAPKLLNGWSSYRL